jgi:hypothetical protein
MNLAFVKSWEIMRSRLQELGGRRWFYPLALLLIGAASYLYALPSLGYYWDDWEVVFLLHTRNLPLLYGYFAYDRPFAWPYELMYDIFGLNAVTWHIVTLLLRWGGVLFLYLALRLVWPRLEPYLRWLGALVLVYPGFLQQSISGAYNRHFTAFALFSFSVYLMALATRHAREGWWLWPLSWITAAIQVITIEYFVGLELVRVILLWMLLGSENPARPRQRLGRALLLAAPYVLVFGVYFWWRLLVFPGTISRSNYAGDFKFLQDFSGSFSTGTMQLLTRALFDLVYSTLQVWLAPLVGAAAFTFQSKVSWFAIALGIGLSVAFSLFSDVSREAEQDTKAGRLTFFLFGFFAFLFSAVPIWLTSRQLSGTGRWDDRFSLGAMLGSGVMTLALIIWLVRTRWHNAVMGFLLAVSITTQVLIVNKYRQEWGVQSAYYWQLAWRVPALRPQTAIFSLEQPSISVPGYDASFALNVLFNGSVSEGAVPYWFFTNDRFLNFAFVPGKQISYKDRNLRFAGNTSDAIAIIHQGGDRCLQVLDAPYAAEPFYAQGQQQLVAVSNVTRILADGAASAPDPGIFGPEPAHNWCYYFEKADLARQKQDWQSVLMLDRQARAAGFKPGFGPEYLPFIQAHAETGNWQKALELSRAAKDTVAGMDPVLCGTWAQLASLPSAPGDIVEQARQEFACTNP